MSIDFGEVQKYLIDRGFGFVTRTFSVDKQSKIFFHIKHVRKIDPKLAERLDQGEQPLTVCFWYQTETTNKGEQVSTIIEAKSVRDKLGESLTDYIAKVEAMWRNPHLPVTSWLNQLTVDLVGTKRAKELQSSRIAIEVEKRQAEEKVRTEREAARVKEEERRHAVEKETREREAARAIEQAKRNILVEEQNAQRQFNEAFHEEEEEFQKLVAEMKPLGFTKSAQVSEYIVKNKLGYKYKKISGHLEMELHGEKWNFKGGFPPNVYARLCQELELGNQESRAKPGKFESFEELAKKGHGF